MNKLKISLKKSLCVLIFLYTMINVFLESSINSGSVSTLLNVIKYTCVLLCALIILHKSIINKEIFEIILIILIAVVFNTFIFGGGSFLIELVLFVLCFKMTKTNVRSVFIASILALLISHIFILFLSSVGILQDNVSYRWVGNMMGSFFAGKYNRHSMGFLASNQVPNTLMIVYLMYAVITNGHTNLFINVIMIALDFWCFLTFGARASFIIILGSVIIFTVYTLRREKKKKKKSKNIIWLSFSIFGLLSFASCILYNPSSLFWRNLNELFYNRLRWGQGALKNYGITIFGNGLLAGSNEGALYNNLEYSNIIDNGYIKTFLQRGVIIGVVIIFLWSYLLYKAQKYNKKYLVIILLIFSVVNLIDDHFLTYKVLPFYCLMLINDADWPCLETLFNKKD